MISRRFYLVQLQHILEVNYIKKQDSLMERENARQQKRHPCEHLSNIF